MSVEENKENKKEGDQELINLDEEGKPLEFAEEGEGEEEEDEENELDENGSLKPKKPKTVAVVFMVIFTILIILGGGLFVYMNYKRIHKFHVIITDNEDELALKASEIISNIIKRKPNAALSLMSGSSTSEGIYKNLVKKYKNHELSFEGVSCYHLGEYAGFSKTNEQSTYYYMHNHFYNYVNINSRNLHFPDVEKDVTKGTEAYKQLIKNSHIDLQLIGLGTNGHIGFNEPGTSFDSTVHVVTLSDSVVKHSSKLFGGDANKVPKLAITMGIKDILKADEILLFAGGRRKAEAVKALIQGKVDPNIPVTALNSFKGTIYVVMDKEAASLL